MRYFSTSGGSVSVIPGTIKATRFRASAHGTISNSAFGFDVSGGSQGNTGIYSEGTNQVAFTGNGTRTGYFNGSIGDFTVTRDVSAGRGLVAILGPNTLAGATAVNGDLTMGTGASLNLDPSTSLTDAPLQFSGDPDTGFGYVGANNPQFITGGAQRANFSSTGFLVAGMVRGSSGFSFAVPAAVVPVAGTTISSNGIVELNPTSGNVTMTATPTFAAASLVGQAMVVTNVHATNNVVLQDADSVAGTDLELTAASITLNPGDTVVFFRTNAGLWRQATPVITT